ncbi:uncharacterized protein PAC_16709 [Phialocephala subalpina]|uniref:Uncharacterized protein n=1 Tax=Phialocephala subalpina TaxID=576137 RepID=A0A1L7XP62_9HELO|nr:uncharacterized protein PAC_16709 [Phialocephala subalpina]
MATEEQLKKDDAHREPLEGVNSHEWFRTSPRAFSKDDFLIFVRVTIATFLASSVPLANASFSIARCCTLAARQDFQTYIADFWPWEVCNFNEAIDFSSNVTYPSIMRSMSWAKQYCNGTQYSSLNQWLQPLCAYISPYIGILLICPVGDVIEHHFAVFGSSKGLSWIEIVLNGVRDPLQEYMSILGDPASTTFGAFNEIWSDVQTMRRLHMKNPEDISWLHRRALWIAALAGVIRFTEQTSWHRDVLEAVDRPGELASENKVDVIRVVGKTDVSEGQKDDIAPFDTEIKTNISQFQHASTSKATDEVDKAIDMIIAARASFTGGVLIPVVLMLAVTAATFYGAYGSIGDKDTALALAYCVWYSWLLVVGVGGNCFASTLNTDLAKRAFGKVLNLGNHPVSVPLRDRYVNNQLWDSWADASTNDGSFGSNARSLKGDWRVWMWFCLGQFSGFCSVAFASACAAAIAWTTPTVGLGCRSFNFILYAVLSFAISYLHVLCSWLSIRARIHAGRNIALLVLRPVYWTLVFVNALTVVLGTLLHLVGVFRTCWCERLTWSDSALIELNSKTAQAVDNARSYRVQEVHSSEDG